MTPPKWLVAPADMGPSWPGLGDMIDHWRAIEEMRRARAAQRKWDEVKARLPDLSGSIITD